jgi:hypothetical protein
VSDEESSEYVRGRRDEHTAAEIRSDDIHSEEGGRRERHEHWRHHKRPSTVLDRILLKWMPNLTVMRRFVFGSYFMKIVLITVVIILIGRINDNAHKIEQSSCVFISVLEDAAQREANLAATDNPANREAHLLSAHRLVSEARQARATGIDCPPPPLGFHLP